jgi:hypothetical protein
VRLRVFAAGVIIFLTACGSVHTSSTTQKTTVIPWIDAIPGLSAATPSPVVGAGTRSCGTSDLRITFDGGQGLGFGQLTATISFVNTSDTGCVLQGVPGFALLNAQGNTIVTNPSGYRITDRSDPVLMAARGDSRQAYVPFAWPGIDQTTGGGPCPSAETATAIRLELPNHGGPFTLSTAHATLLPVVIAPCHGSIAVGAFQAAAPSADTTPAPYPFSYRVDVPASVRAGDNLSYTVTITNIGQTPAAFSDPCPTYHEDLYPIDAQAGPLPGKHLYFLNCQPIRRIAAGASVTFAMILEVPAMAIPGKYTLIWAPQESPNVQDIHRVAITITR